MCHVFIHRGLLLHPRQLGRRLKPAWLGIACLLALLAARLAAADTPPASTAGFYDNPIQFDLRVGAWLPQSHSNQKTSNIADNRINFDNLDVSPDNAFAVGEINLTFLGWNRLRAEYWDSTSSGKTFLANNITFNGTVFPAGSNVQSTIQASALKLGYEFLVVNDRGFRLGLGGGATIFSSKSQIKLTSGATSSTRHDDRTIWFLSGDLAFKVAFLELFGSIDALSYHQAALLDTRAGVSFDIPIPFDSPVVEFGIGADWRLWDARITDNQVDAQWTIQGLELFVFLRF